MNALRLENTLLDLIGEIRHVASLADGETTKQRIAELLRERANHFERIATDIRNRT